MRHFLFLLILLFGCSVYGQVTDESYESFVKRYNVGIDSLKNEQEEFIKNYKKELNEFSKSYGVYLDGEIQTDSIMLTDDKETVIPKEIQEKKMSNTIDIKKKINEDKGIKNWIKDTPDSIVVSKILGIPNDVSNKEKLKLLQIVNETVDNNKKDKSLKQEETPISEKLANRGFKLHLEEATNSKERGTKLSISSELISKSKSEISKSQTTKKDRATKLTVEKTPDKGVITSKKSNDIKSRMIPSGCPLHSKYRVSSPFGPRVHPVYGSRKPHKGIDLAAPRGTKIYAPMDCKVSYAGRARGYGNYIKLDALNGYKCGFGHLNRILVKSGQRIKKGDIIAEVGSTGVSTGPHLHYEVILKNHFINPAPTFND
ncbi:peptidoglycan DD-metalloendopeptidase family protein [Halosquirtibacter laminarini]|uniref:Peptidoglycan DD-metalloendopeptidase family protein n=1 Tax=Halosquirtibacter laminarini TaxID=3374600 RepID=A0AC61NE19_9BACT|nr:peptidoglycan DD-metalloendopeptidase family protein [Prolixibacteraceae bacterium]